MFFSSIHHIYLIQCLLYVFFFLIHHIYLIRCLHSYINKLIKLIKQSEKSLVLIKGILYLFIYLILYIKILIYNISSFCTVNSFILYNYSPNNVSILFNLEIFWLSDESFHFYVLISDHDPIFLMSILDLLGFCLLLFALLNCSFL